MCEWKTTKVLIIKGVKRDIDSCIYDLVKILNGHGMQTIATCCGHSKQPSSIVLKDGRELRIFDNYEDARKVDKLFPPIN